MENNNKEVNSMATTTNGTTIKIPVEMIKRYESINLGKKFNKVKGKFTDFAKAVLERELEVLEQDAVALKKSA